MSISFSGITKIKNMPFGNEEVFGYTVDTEPKRRSMADWTARNKLGLGRGEYQVVENEPDVFILDGEHKSLDRQALMEGLASGALKPDRTFVLRILSSVSMPGGAGTPAKPAPKSWWARLLGR